ncbi:divalent-cation tolerance protein CutA [Limisphaera sp. 4302-co]|uniref:divalent-cation tolerance protein CutA n=1 Tax=Limisphaera sp. 4302-co TaxID=3400417 RepID=UPI003C219166
MKHTRNVVIVLMTAPDMETARRLARGALEARLVACVNLVPGVESHYWWEGRVEQAGEVLMIAKTLRSQLGLLEAWIRREHPYKVPELLVTPVHAGLDAYLNWLAAECGALDGTVPDSRSGG